MYVSDLTSNQWNGLDPETVVVLPVGGLSATGESARLGRLNDQLADVLDRLNEAVPDVLIAPLLPIRWAGYDSGLPGELSLGEATLRAVIRDYAGAFQRAGFRRFVLLGAVGPDPVLELAALELSLQPGNVVSLEFAAFGSHSRTGQILPHVILDGWAEVGTPRPVDGIVATVRAAREPALHGRSPG